MKLKNFFHFDKKNLLRQALTHKSISQSCNNQRLEFLGDAVLNMIFSDFLYKEYPSEDEGALSLKRVNYIKGSTLSILAKKLNLQSHLLYCKSIPKITDKMLSDAFEALVAAIYLDSESFIITSKVILSMYDKFTPCLAGKSYHHPKTKLQQYLQELHLPIPQYCAEAQDRNSFKVKIYIPHLDMTWSQKSHSVKCAEEQLAKRALRFLEDDV